MQAVLLVWREDLLADYIATVYFRSLPMLIIWDFTSRNVGFVKIVSGMIFKLYIRFVGWLVGCFCVFVFYIADLQKFILLSVLYHK